MEFSSENYHSGGTPSRKDEIISFLFLLAYFQKGELPWSKIVHSKLGDREKSKGVLELKRNLSTK